MSIIQKGWKDYKEKVIPKDASEIQLSETEKAFFAGAVVVFSAVYATGEEDVSENEALDVLTELNDEITAHIAKWELITNKDRIG